MRKLTITEGLIRAGSNAQSFERGQDYYRNHAISQAAIQGTLLTAECEGTQVPYYQVRAELDDAGIRTAQCTCRYDDDGYCKHIVALLLHYLHHPAQFTLRQEPAELLASLDRDALIALITKLLREHPALYDAIAATLAIPMSPTQAKKATSRHVDVEVYRRQIRHILHSLDGMRASEAYWQVSGMVDQLRGVRVTAQKFLEADAPETALTILLALLEEVGNHIDYIDDSDGNLYGFFSDLGLPLAEVILSLDLTTAEQKKLLTTLTKLDKRLSDYGMDDCIDLAMDAVHYGWGTLPAKVPTPAYRENDDDDEEVEASGDDDREEDDHTDATSVSPDLTDAQLNVLERQGRTDDYLALCQQAQRHLRYAMKLGDLGQMSEAVRYAMVHLVSAEEALKMAEGLRALNQIPDAITIAERGLQLPGSKMHLGAWLGPIEEAQGRKTQALQAWLAAFPESPTLDMYQTLQRLAEADWVALRPDLMAILQVPYHDQTLVDVLLYEEEWDAAIAVAERRNIWYRIVESVVDAVLPYRTEWALQTSRQQAEHLMIEPKSKYYPQAAAWLQRAKQAYQRLGRTDEWQTYLQGIKEQYKRRPALQAELKRL